MTSTMLPVRSLYLLFVLSPSLCLCGGTSRRDDGLETPQTAPDTLAQGGTQISWRPHRPTPSYLAEFLALPFDGTSLSFDETDRQGVIGEYVDTQDSSELSILSPTEKWVMAPSSTDSPNLPTVAASEGAVGPARDVISQPNWVKVPQHRPTETNFSGTYGPVPNSSLPPKDRPILSAKEGETTRNQSAVLESGSVPGDLESSPTSSTAPQPDSEYLRPTLSPDRWRWNKAPSPSRQREVQGGTSDWNGSGDGFHGFTDDLLNKAGVTKESVQDVPASKEWQDPGFNETSSSPDCKLGPHATPCNTSSQSVSPNYPEDVTTNESQHPSSVISPPLFVPLYSDWNSALATWGLAWEVHIYGLGCVFAMFGVISVICLLGLPLRCPPGIPYFTLLHLLLLGAVGMRAFSLVYDAYSHQDRLPPLASLLLSELPLPCLTSAFSQAFLLLSLRSRMHLSLPLALSTSISVLPRPCLLICLSLLHFGISLGSVGLLHLLNSFPVLLLLLPQGTFVCLCFVLAFSYLLFYCIILADTRHIYRLNDSGEGGGSPELMQPVRCPFAEREDWGRAAGAGVGASLCLLGCGGLQLYGILHTLGVGGISGFGFQPWPWLGYQLGCRLCEVGVCLGLSLIGTRPLLCHANPIRSKTHPRAGSWSRLSCGSPSGGPTHPPQLTEPSSAVTPHYPWSLAKQEKLVICEVITKARSENLPLCSMVDPPRNGVDTGTAPFPSHSWTSTLPLPTPPQPPERARGGIESQLSSLDSLGLDTDSTADLRPPSPIDLSRSIDQALFSEALFPHSLFDPPRLPHASSSLSLNSPTQGASQLGQSSADSPLYRTSSCGDVDHDMPAGALSPYNKPPSSPEQWRCWKGSNTDSLCQVSLIGSSQGLCSGQVQKAKEHPHPWTNKGQHLPQSSLPRAIPHLSHHRRYRTLSLASQDSQGSGRLAGTGELSESRQLERDLAVQAEFINVCKQIDALSVCSDTIDL